MIRSAFALATSAALLAPHVARAQSVSDGSDYAVIPRPTVLTPVAGHLMLEVRTTLRSDPAFVSVARGFARDVERATGFVLAVARNGRRNYGGEGKSRCRHDTWQSHVFRSLSDTANSD